MYKKVDNIRAIGCLWAPVLRLSFHKDTADCPKRELLIGGYSHWEGISKKLISLKLSFLIIASFIAACS